MKIIVNCKHLSDQLKEVLAKKLFTVDQFGPNEIRFFNDSDFIRVHGHITETTGGAIELNPVTVYMVRQWTKTLPEQPAVVEIDYEGGFDVSQVSKSFKF